MYATGIAHVLVFLASFTGCTADFGILSCEGFSPRELAARWDTALPLERDAMRKHLLARTHRLEPWILDALITGSVNQRLLACAVLERLATPQAEAALREVALADSDARVQAQAMLSLARFAGPDAAEAIRLKLASTTDRRVVKAALASLGGFGEAKDAALATAFLSDPDESVRVNAAAALARLGDESGASILLDATHSADPQSCREATFALGFLGTHEAAQRLDEIIADPAGRWRTEAELAVAIRTRSAAPTAPKHSSVVHGRGVLGDPNRSLAANAFAVLDSPFYTAWNARDTSRGTVDEDIGSRPINHFYNPVTGVNSMPASRMAAVERAELFWERAVDLYRRGQFWGRAGAFHMLGRSMHLLQDMTSPAHVHDDPHVPPLDPDDFEFYGEIHYPTPEEIVPGLAPYVPQGELTLPDGRTVPAGSVAGLIHGMALFTYRLTAYPGEIVADRVQPDSELARMFPDGRLYYQDAGILGANYWQIDDVGPFGLLEENDWWPGQADFVDEDPGDGVPQRITGLFYIENVSGDHGGLTPAVFERPLRHVEDPRGMTFLEIYAGELYPECVSRSATYLDTFRKTVAPDTGGCSGAPASSLEASAGDTLLGLLVAATLFAAGRRRR